MKASDIRELSVEEISKKIRETREQHLDLRVRKQVGQVEKSHELKAYRRDIARMETVLTEKKSQAIS